MISLTSFRMPNRKNVSMQNLEVMSRPTLGKMETAPQIGEDLERVSTNTILNHECKYKQWLRDQNYAHMQGQKPLAER